MSEAVISLMWSDFCDEFGGSSSVFSLELGPWKVLYYFCLGVSHIWL